MRTKQILSFLLLGGLILACQKDVKQGSASANGVSDAKTKAAYGVPTLACGDGTTQRSIDIVVTAASTGAASGFTVQWISTDALAAFVAGGGHVDATGWPVDTNIVCGGSFSGNANLSRYNLLAGQSVTVTIGDLLYDNGASTNCPDALTCGTTYLFRAFAHGDSKLNQSHFGATTSCTTLDCDNSCGHQGYGHWKNNCDEIATVTGGNGLTLGGNVYSDADLCCILNENPSPGNGLIIVAHHLIAAKLNGADASVTAAADAYIGSALIPTCTNGSLAFKKANTAAGLIGSLNHFNNTCP